MTAAGALAASIASAGGRARSVPARRQRDADRRRRASAEHQHRRGRQPAGRPHGGASPSRRSWHSARSRPTRATRPPTPRTAAVRTAAQSRSRPPATSASARSPRAAAAAGRSAAAAPAASSAISGDRVTTGAITTLGREPERAGRQRDVAAQSALLVGGAVDTSGAAGGNGQPGRHRRRDAPGSGARAAHARRAPALGRRHGQRGSGGAPGGNGGSIELVVQSIASSDGRPRGWRQRRHAGARTARAARRQRRPRARLGAAPLADPPAARRLDGRHGRPRTAPTARSRKNPRRRVSRSRRRARSRSRRISPDAEGYRVFLSIAGAPAKAVLTTKAAERPAAEGRGLRQGRLHALRHTPTRIGWQSDPIGPVTLHGAAVRTQACTDAPAGHARRRRS